MRDVKALHPYLQMLAEELVRRCEQRGLNIKITDCVRTKAEQDASLKKGTTQVRYPFSYHAWGLAFDICKNSANVPYPQDITWWNKVGQIGEELGLEWGGRWTDFVDRPHFQLTAYGTCSELIGKYIAPYEFFAHKDYKVVTPKTPILPTSSKKKVLWLQVRLTIAGYKCTLDGEWGEQTQAQLKKFWKDYTGKNCTGLVCSVKCIEMLDGQ